VSIEKKKERPKRGKIETAPLCPVYNHENEITGILKRRKTPNPEEEKEWQPFCQTGD